MRETARGPPFFLVWLACTSRYHRPPTDENGRAVPPIAAHHRHPTDLSPNCVPAFAQARRLVMEFRTKLALLPADASLANNAAQTGVTVHKAGIRDSDAATEIPPFARDHQSDLVMRATRT